MSHDGSSCKSYIKHPTEKERLDNLAFTSFPEDYLPYTSAYHQRDGAKAPPYLVWDERRPRRSHKRRRKCCSTAALTSAIALIVTAILAIVAISVYLGVITNLFRSPVLSLSGKFRVSKGDEFLDELLNSTSNQFLHKAETYQAMVENAFLSSSLEPAFIAARIYSFKPGMQVFFRVYLDRRKLDQDDSNTIEIIKNIVKTDSPAFGALSIEQGSVNIDENEEWISMPSSEQRTTRTSVVPTHTSHPTLRTSSRLPPPKLATKPNKPSTAHRPSKRPITTSSTSDPFLEKKISATGSGEVHLISPHQNEENNFKFNYGQWKPVPIEDSVSPSFGDQRTPPGRGSVRYIDEVISPPRVPPPLLQRTTAKPKITAKPKPLPVGFGSVRILDDPLSHMDMVPVPRPMLRTVAPDTNRGDVASSIMSSVSLVVRPANKRNSTSGKLEVVSRPPDRNPQRLQSGATRKDHASYRFLDVIEDGDVVSSISELPVDTEEVSDVSYETTTEILPETSSKVTDSGAVKASFSKSFVEYAVSEESTGLKSNKNGDIKSADHSLHLSEDGTKLNDNSFKPNGFSSNEELTSSFENYFEIETTTSVPFYHSGSNVKSTEVNTSDVEISSPNISTIINLSDDSTHSSMSELISAQSELTSDSNIPYSTTILDEIVFWTKEDDSYGYDITTEVSQTSFTPTLENGTILPLNYLDKTSHIPEHNNKKTPNKTVETYIPQDGPKPVFDNINKEHTLSEHVRLEVHTHEGHGFHQPSEKEDIADVNKFTGENVPSTTDVVNPSLNLNVPSTTDVVNPSLNLNVPSTIDLVKLNSNENTLSTIYLDPSSETEGDIATSSIDLVNHTILLEDNEKIFNQTTVSQNAPSDDSKEASASSLVTTMITGEVQSSNATPSPLNNPTTFDDAAGSTSGISSNTETIIIAGVPKVVEQFPDLKFNPNDIDSDDGNYIKSDEDLLDHDFSKTSTKNFSLIEVIRHVTTISPTVSSIAVSLGKHPVFIFKSCSEDQFRCESGECVDVSSRCNMSRECRDNSDEKNCSCSEFLKVMGQSQKICDGVEDCKDHSDEINCPWCIKGQILCPQTKFCINQTQMCDGHDDCPNGIDEKYCVKLAQSVEDAEDNHYRPDGYLMVRKQGQWGKLCLANLEDSEDFRYRLDELGEAVCSSLTYHNVSESKRIQDLDTRNENYYSISNKILSETKRSSAIFTPSTCKSKEVMHVHCGSLDCGLRPMATSNRRRIVGGVSAGSASWPWQVALYKEGDFQCGAVLVSDTWLISASHCFYSSQTAYWTARLGLLRRGSELPSPYEQVRRIESIFLHPDYIDKGFINDIAMLKMDRPVLFSDFLRPICLPLKSEDPGLWHGKQCSVVGWGKLYEIGNTFPDSLQEVRLRVISTEECRKKIVFLTMYHITNNMFCAGYERGGKDACLGDSGGPLMCQREDGRWILSGVISNGDGCGRPGRPGVYTKVLKYLGWIKQIMDTKYISGNFKDTCRGVRCQLGRCIPSHRVCDSRWDCSDGTDEDHCLD